MTTSLSLDRSALSDSPLVIGLYSMSATYFLPLDGLYRPDFTMRRSFAPDGDIPGKQQLQAVPDIGTFPMAVYIQADSSADLQTAMDDLSVACTQWAFDITETIDGVARTYPVYGEFPQWGQVDAGMVRAFMVRAAVTFPVNPS